MTILQSVAGLPAFLVYFCTGLVAIVAYLFAYTRITPHNELQLIRDNDPAAAIALGLSLLGCRMQSCEAFSLARTYAEKPRTFTSLRRSSAAAASIHP